MAGDGGFRGFRLPLNSECLLKMWNLKCIKVFRTLDAFLLKRTICKSEGQFEISIMSPQTRPRKRLYIQGRLALYALQCRL